MSSPPDIHDDYSWVKISPGCWGYGSKYSTQYRSGFGYPTPLSFRDVRAAISCIGPGEWVIHINGEHCAQVEGWNEAKSIAALLLGSKEME